MHAFVSRARAVLAHATVALVLAGCGGGSDAPPTDTTPPPPVDINHVPVPVITVASTGTAGQALAFDAGTSSDADGDALVYTWDFGDGAHGGGAALAHIYGAAGTVTVTLTVSDGKGGIASATKSIAVGSGPAAGATAPVTGTVGDASGPLAGVTAQIVGGGAASATSDATGKLNLALPTGVPVVLRLSKSGYADQTVALNLPAGAPNATFKAGMLAREASVDLDATAGGIIVGKNGATVVFPAGALVTPAGAAASGVVQVAITPVDVRNGGVALFPGAFAGVDTSGSTQPIASYGTAEFTITQGGQKLQLAPGKTATIELPIYTTLNLDGSAVAVGQSIPLWSLDEASGQWIQEGSGVVVASTTSASGLSMRATVGHFSWWNCDTLLNPPPPYMILPKCYYSPGPEFTPIPEPCSIGPLLPGEYHAPGGTSTRARIQDAADGFRFPPSYGVRADIPAAGGVSLPVPSGVDFVVIACSRGGFACGTTTVHGAAGGSGELRIDLSPIVRSGCSAPTALTLPVNAEFTVADTAQASCLSFQSSAGQVISVFVQQGDRSPLAGRYELQDPTGTVLVSGVFPNTNISPLRRMAPVDGTYRLVFTTAGNSPPGNYLLIASQVASTPIAVPAPAVTVANTGDVDYSFPIAAGQMLAASVRPRAHFATILSLVDGSSHDIRTSTGDITYGAITFSSSRAGQVGFNDKITQAFGGGVQPDSIITVEPMTTLAVGDLGSGSIAVSDEVKSYAFNGHAGDIVFANVLADGGTVPFIRLLDPTDKDLLTSIGSSVNGWRGGPLTLTSDGMYRIDAFDSTGNTTPSYAVRVSAVAPPAPIAITGDATTVNGSIDGIGDQRYYTLTLNQGDSIRLSYSSPGALGLALDLLQPDASKPFYARTVLAELRGTSNDNSGINFQDGATDMVTVPQSGDYVLHVGGISSRLSAGTGAFSVTYQNPAAVALPVSTTVSDTLASPWGFRRYAVAIATAGDYRFCVRSPGSVRDQLRNADDSIDRTTINRSGTSLVNPEFVITLPVGTYTWNVYAKQKDAATFDVTYRPAAEAHAICQ